MARTGAAGLRSALTLPTMMPRTLASMACSRAFSSKSRPPTTRVPWQLTSMAWARSGRCGLSTSTLSTPSASPPVPHTPWIRAPTVPMTTPRPGMTFVTCPFRWAFSSNDVGKDSIRSRPLRTAITVPSTGERQARRSRPNRPPGAASTSSACTASPTALRMYFSAWSDRTRNARPTSTTRMSPGRSQRATTSAGPTSSPALTTTSPRTGNMRSRRMVANGVILVSIG